MPGYKTTSASWRHLHNNYIFHCSEKYKWTVEYNFIPPLSIKKLLYLDLNIIKFSTKYITVFCCCFSVIKPKTQLTFLGRALFLDPDLCGASQTRLVLFKMSRPATESTDRSSSSFILANSSPSWANFAADREPGISRNRFTSWRDVVMLNLKTRESYTS